MGMMSPIDEVINQQNINRRKNNFIASLTTMDDKTKAMNLALNYIRKLTAEGIQFTVTYDAYCIDFTFNGSVHSQAAYRALPSTANMILTGNFGKLIMNWSK
jgi:hypothetical protein